MTFTTSQDIARAAAPTSGIMKTPDHLEALITKDLKPFGWRKAIEQVERMTKRAEREQEIQAQRQKIEEERKRREKIAKFEIDRKRNADFYSRSMLKLDKETGKAGIQNSYLNHPMRTERMIAIFCKAFNASQENLTAQWRKRELVKSRQILMWILHSNSGISYSALGRRIGRDHSTCMHAVSKINNTPELLKLAEEMQATVLFLEREAYGDE